MVQGLGFSSQGLGFGIHDEGQEGRGVAVVVAIAAVVARVPVLALELQPAVGTIIRYNIISADKRNQATSFSS